MHIRYSRATSLASDVAEQLNRTQWNDYNQTSRLVIIALECPKRTPLELSETCS